MMSGLDIFQLLILGAIWGSSFLFMRHAAPQLGAPTTAELRLAIAAMILIAVAWKKHKSLHLHLWRSYLFVGFFNCAFPFLLFAYAAKQLPSGYLSVINATSPAFGALFGALILKESLSVRCVAGLIVGLFGVGVLMALGPVEISISTAIGALCGLVASMSYGFAVSYLNPLIKRAPGVVIAAGTLTAASLILAPAVYFFPPQFGYDPVAIGSAVTLGVLCTGIAYLIYFDLVTRMRPTRAIVVTFLVPVFATFWGVIFLDERFTARMTIGALLALLGTYLVISKGAGRRVVRNISKSA